MKLFRREAMQPSYRREDVSLRLDRQVFRWEDFPEEASDRQGGKAPVLAPEVVIETAELADPGLVGDERAVELRSPTALIESIRQCRVVITASYHAAIEDAWRAAPDRGPKLLGAADHQVRWSHTEIFRLHELVEDADG